MKRIIILLLAVCSMFITHAQTFVDDSTSQFELPLSSGSFVFDKETARIWQITTKATATGTLATTTKREVTSTFALADSVDFLRQNISDSLATIDIPTFAELLADNNDAGGNDIINIDTLSSSNNGIHIIDTTGGGLWLEDNSGGGMFFHDNTGGGTYFNDYGGGGTYFADINGGGYYVETNTGINLNYKEDRFFYGLPNLHAPQMVWIGYSRASYYDTYYIEQDNDITHKFYVDSIVTAHDSTTFLRQNISDSISLFDDRVRLINSSNSIFSPNADIDNITTSNSILIGNLNGSDALGVTSSVLLGSQIAQNSTSITNSFLAGSGICGGASSINSSIISGYSTGNGASNISNSILLGSNTSSGASGVTNTNQIGTGTGGSSIDIMYSNQIGSSAGYGSENVYYSDFVGNNSGKGALDINNTVYIGNGAGQTSENTSNTISIGLASGKSMKNTSKAIAIGEMAGHTTDSVDNSIMLGYQAGRGTDNAKNLISIGKNSAYLDNVRNDDDDYSILLGNYTSTGGYSNSIALGGGTSADKVENTKSNQLLIGSDTYPINEIYINGCSSLGDLIISNQTAPASATDTGIKGEIRITADYIYVCIDTDTWVRSALSTW